MERVLKAVAFLCLIAVIQASSCCPDKWSAYKNKCYRVFEEKYEWGTAENICVNQHGGHLACPSTSDEFDFLNTYVIGGRTYGFWIGANDIASENNWKWIDGSEWKYSAWKSGEPDGGSSQDCAITNHQNSQQWYDEYCYAKWGFICERPSI